jgi:hypothetical protein
MSMTSFPHTCAGAGYPLERRASTDSELSNASTAELELRGSLSPHEGVKYLGRDRIRVSDRR